MFRPSNSPVISEVIIIFNQKIYLILKAGSRDPIKSVKWKNDLKNLQDFAVNFSI